MSPRRHRPSFAWCLLQCEGMSSSIGLLASIEQWARVRGASVELVFDEPGVGRCVVHAHGATFGDRQRAEANDPNTFHLSWLALCNAIQACETWERLNA